MPVCTSVPSGLITVASCKPGSTLLAQKFYVLTPPQLTLPLTKSAEMSQHERQPKFGSGLLSVFRGHY